MFTKKAECVSPSLAVNGIPFASLFLNINPSFFIVSVTLNWFVISTVSEAVNFLVIVAMSLTTIFFTFNVFVKSRFVPEASLYWIWLLDWISTALISFAQISRAFKSFVKSRFVPEASTKLNCIVESIVGADIVVVALTFVTSKSPLKVIPVPCPFVKFISLARISITFKSPVKSIFVPEASTNCIWVVDSIFVALISFAHISTTFISPVKSRFVPEASTKSMNLDEVIVSLTAMSLAFNVSVKSKFVPEASTNWIWVLDWIFTVLISFAQMSRTFISPIKFKFVPEASTKFMMFVE